MPLMQITTSIALGLSALVILYGGLSVSLGAAAVVSVIVGVLWLPLGLTIGD